MRGFMKDAQFSFTTRGSESVEFQFTKGCQLSHTQNVSKKIGCMALGQYRQLMILSHVQGLLLLPDFRRG